MRGGKEEGRNVEGEHEGVMDQRRGNGRKGGNSSEGVMKGVREEGMRGEMGEGRGTQRGKTDEWEQEIDKGRRRREEGRGEEKRELGREGEGSRGEKSGKEV